MKILHTADTHLGFAAYRKANKEGINQREIDVYNAFEKFVNYALKEKPDLILHSGDLFDSVRPNNRAITFAIKQFVRLSQEKIPVVMISGNHEHPKLKETGHIFSIFDHIKNIYPIYNEKYEKVDLEIDNKKVTIHAIPQCNSKQLFDKELKKLKKEKESIFNIFIAHGSVTGMQEFTMNEFNELIIPARILSRDFDYIGLGHFHRHSKLSENAFYSGSIERLTFAEAEEKKGFLKINITKGSLKHEFIEIETRPMIDSKPIKCSELKIDQIMKKIKKEIKKIDPKEKTVRITLDDISQNVYRNLDFSSIKKEFSSALHYELKVKVKDENEKKQNYTSSKIDALVNEFTNFLENQDIGDKKTLTEMGIGYIEKIEAKNEGK